MSSKALSSGLAIAFAAAVLLASPYANAQPPGTAVYEYRPDLGGWLDTERGVVWGYSLSDSLNASITRDAAVNFSAGTYPDLLFAKADFFVQQAEYWWSLSAFYAESDPARSQRDAEIAAQCEGDAAAFEEAATVADQFTNWRAPSLAEFQDAYNKGLFSRGEDGFNMDMSPAVGYQEGYGGNNWTSEPTKKIKGKENGLQFNIDDGTTRWMSPNGANRAIVTRTYMP